MQRSQKTRDGRSALTALHYSQNGLPACAYPNAGANTSGKASTQVFRCPVAGITSHESPGASNKPRTTNHQSLLIHHHSRIT